MKNKYILQLVSNYKKTLNKNSKFFASDVEDYKRNLLKLSVKDLQTRLGNSNAINEKHSTFNQQVKAEERKMLKGGMFNIGNMKPTNCLD